jgi:hypothetical protein
VSVLSEVRVSRATVAALQPVGVRATGVSVLLDE